MSIKSSSGLGRDLPTRKFYSVRETEQIINASHATIYRLIGDGRLDARKLNGKTLISAESIERLAAELPKARSTHNGGNKLARSAG
jgi:hypothetical protein